MILLVLAIFLFLVENGVSYPYEKCKTMTLQNLKTCKAKNITRCYRHVSYICKRELKIARIDLKPYNNLMAGFLGSMMIPDCCGGCHNITHAKNFTSQEEFAGSLNSGYDDADMVFPILGAYDTTTISGWYFMPVVNIPRLSLVTYKKGNREILLDLIYAALMLWPLLSICLMMALIAGFFMWITDTWMNTDEFPRGFLKGTFEGFWWAFISMTTVGYGDKSPKSYIARIFAVLWILLGITIFSMFTASLTNILHRASWEKTSVQVNGKTIGVQMNSLVEDTFVLKRGGIIGPRGDLHYLLNLLIHQKVDAVVTDLMSTSFILKEMSWLVDYISLYEVELTEEKFSYGVMVKDRLVYEYFGSYCRDNQIFIQACIFKDLSRVEIYNDKGHGSDLFNPKSGLFWPSFYVTLGTLVGIMIFGIIYEIARKKIWNKGIKTTQHDKSHNESALVKEIQAILDSYSSDENQTKTRKKDENHENDDGSLSYFNRHINCIQ